MSASAGAGGCSAGWRRRTGARQCGEPTAGARHGAARLGDGGSRRGCGAGVEAVSQLEIQLGGQGAERGLGGRCGGSAARRSPAATSAAGRRTRLVADLDDLDRRECWRRDRRSGGAGSWGGRCAAGREERQLGMIRGRLRRGARWRFRPHPRSAEPGRSAPPRAAPRRCPARRRRWRHGRRLPRLRNGGADGSAEDS